MSLLQRLFKRKKQANITICGLDQAGKTSVLNYLIYGEPRPTIPTMGININTINLPKLGLLIHDLGGQDTFRQLWPIINEKSDALIYIVDSTDFDRFEKTKNIFHEIINTQINNDIPVLILLNKIDVPDRMSRAEFIYRFNLLDIQANIRWSCYETSAKTGYGLVEAFTDFIHYLEDEI
ncbi:MAG: GTP-binding protein [Candidatus Heimdallarchaeota archaeon]|nr:GTP-binding protein [Candidatus Heimdallarchaeota archaeon]